MRLSSSSHPHKQDRKLGSNAPSPGLGWRGSLRATAPFLSAPCKLTGDQLSTASDSAFWNLESEPGCVAVRDSIPSRFCTTAAAYSTHTAPHNEGVKALMRFMWPGQRFTLTHEGPSGLLETNPYPGRDRYPIKSIRKANTNSGPLVKTTGPAVISGKWKNTVRDAAFSSAPRLGTSATCGTLLKTRRTENTDAALLPYSPQLMLSSTLIPSPRLQDVGKLVVVLDLDETLVHSRGTTIFKRPGVAQLLRTLKGKCEVIVWTAGTREYALNVIRMIDTVCAVQHCIYRHPMWWTGDVGCAKDLRLLGRPMDRVLLVDNTPSVFRANPRNSLLVEDFIVPHSGGYSAQEKTLSVLADIFEHVFRRFTSPCVADVLASRRISRQVIQLERGTYVELNVLTPG